MQVRRGVKGAGVIWWMFFLLQSAFLAHISRVYMILWSKVISAKTKQKVVSYSEIPHREKKTPQSCPCMGGLVLVRLWENSSHKDLNCAL